MTDWFIKPEAWRYVKPGGVAQYYASQQVFPSELGLEEAPLTDLRPLEGALYTTLPS